MNVTTTDDIELRLYQKETLQQTRNAYENGVNRLLNVQATGLGKTISFAHLPARFPELAEHGMLVVVHTTELAKQAISEIEWICPNLKVGLEKATHEADTDCDVVVTSRQTLGRSGSDRLDRLTSEIPFGIVVVDEAHHVKPNGQYDNILSPLGLGTSEESDQLPDGTPRLSVGWTATPRRNDGIGLHHFYDRVGARYDIEFGIRSGYLCDIDARRVDTSSHLENVDTTTGDFAKGQLEEETNTPTRNQLVVNAWEKYVDGRAIAYCVTKQHARDLAAQFRENGISAKEITADTPDEEREKLVNQYQDGTLQVLTNVGIFTEGFDAPATKGLLMARPTQSRRLYMQMMGRVSRTNPSDIGNLKSTEKRLEAIENSGKQKGVVVDFVDLTSDQQELVTAPTLFGLSADFEPKDEDDGVVQSTKEKVEELVEQNPMKEREIRNAETIEDMEVEAEEITVFDIANTDDKIEEISQYEWMRIGLQTYQITIYDDDFQYTIRVEENQLDRWEVTINVPSQYVNGDRREGTSFEWDVTFDDLEKAINNVDRSIEEEHDGSLSLIKQEASWHSDDASEGQKSYLDDLNVDYPEDITKGEASKLIDAKKAMNKRENSSRKSPSRP